MNRNEPVIYNCINNIPLFEILNKKQKDFVFKYVKHKSFKAGETIYIPGEQADSLYIISSGKIRIYRLSLNGKEQLIRLLIPGEFTGELALFKKGEYEAYAEALVDTNICTINHHDFKNILVDYPEIATTMLSELSNRLSDSEQQTAWITTKTVRERLIHYLARSASLDKNKTCVIDFNIAKKDLASYLGTTPETLSREWTKLESEGIIKQLSKNKIMLIGLNIDFNACNIL